MTWQPDEKAFRKIFKYYYQEPFRQMKEALKEEGTIYPSPEQQEKIVDSAFHNECAFRFIDDLEHDALVPLTEKDPKFYSNGFTDNKMFLRHLHRSYLIPYLVFARFAYQMVQEMNISREEWLGATYQISLPLQLKSFSGYNWYLQRSTILSFKNNLISRHINTYHFERPCVELEDGSLEHRFIEATALQHNSFLHEKLQIEISARMKEYLKLEVFGRWHLKIIDLIQQSPLLSNLEIAEKLNLKRKERINELNKEIIELIQTHLGLRFITVREAVSSLRRHGYL